MKNETQSITLRFRVTPSFMKMFILKYKKSNLNTYSDFIRLSIEKTIIKEQSKHTEKLRYELNKIGLNINQIAQYSNSCKKVDMMVHNELKKINKNISLLFENTLDS
jgi:hypothetical protein